MSEGISDKTVRAVLRRFYFEVLVEVEKLTPLGFSLAIANNIAMLRVLKRHGVGVK